MRVLLLALPLLFTGCIFTPDKTMCLRFDGGSPLHGALLRDEWGRGDYFQIMEGGFWDKGYKNGEWVEFKVQRRRMNSGHAVIEAVKYLGNCDKDG